jgi:hypothetical protein
MREREKESKRKIVSNPAGIFFTFSVALYESAASCSAKQVFQYPSRHHYDNNWRFIQSAGTKHTSLSLSRLLLFLPLSYFPLLLILSLSLSLTHTHTHIDVRTFLLSVSPIFFVVQKCAFILFLSF